MIILLIHYIIRNKLINHLNIDRYFKMTLELNEATDILKLKILEELNEDFRRAEYIIVIIKIK